MAEATLASCNTDQDKEEMEEVDRRWSDLTSDLLSLIRSRLVAGDVFIFKSVCKSWQSIIPPPLPLALPPPTDSPFFASPSLMCSWGGNPIKMFHPLYNQFYYPATPQLLENGVAYCSNNGWLLISTGDHRSLWFVNPLTGVTVKLPRSGWSFQTMSCFSLQNSSNWSIVGVSNEYFSANSIGILNPGEKRWTFHHCETNHFFHVSCSPVLFRGMYYFLDTRGSVGVLDPENIESGWKIFKSLKRRIQRFLMQSFMVEVDEQLVAVFITHDERKVHVKKLNLSSMVWEPLQDLGDRTLYMSLRGSFAKTALTKSMANTIYFPKFYENSGVFYSLTTGKYHSLDGKFRSRKCYGLTERELGMWFQPSPDTVTDQLKIKWMGDK